MLKQILYKRNCTGKNEIKQIKNLGKIFEKYDVKTNFIQEKLHW